LQPDTAGSAPAFCRLILRLRRAEARMPDKTESARQHRNTETLRAQMERLDQLMRVIYGSSFSEFLRKFFRQAYSEGREEGKREGYAAGRRAAKGIKGDPKKRGRPLEIEQGVKTLMAWHVDQQRIDGKTVKKSINEFLAIMRRGEPRTPLPSAKKAMQAYYRHRK
jgi:predicted transposase YdaD